MSSQKKSPSKISKEERISALQTISAENPESPLSGSPLSERPLSERPLSRSPLTEEEASLYRRVKERYSDLPDGKAIVVTLSDPKVSNYFRERLYDRFGEGGIRIESQKQSDKTYKMMIYAP